MMSSRQLIRLLAALNVGVGIISAGVIASVLTFPGHSEPDSIPLRKPHQRSSQEETVLLSAARSQPVFTSLRTLPVDDEATSSPSDAPLRLSPPRLVGIVQAKGKGARVLLQDASTGKQQVARQGEVVNGWRVSQIERKHVVLVYGGEKITLDLWPEDMRGLVSPPPALAVVPAIPNAFLPSSQSPDAALPPSGDASAGGL